MEMQRTWPVAEIVPMVAVELRGPPRTRIKLRAPWPQDLAALDVRQLLRIEAAPQAAAAPATERTATPAHVEPAEGRAAKAADIEIAIEGGRPVPRRTDEDLRRTAIANACYLHKLAADLGIAGAGPGAPFTVTRNARAYVEWFMRLGGLGRDRVLDMRGQDFARCATAVEQLLVNHARVAQAAR